MTSTVTPTPPSTGATDTVLGVLALLFWSATIAVSRGLAEQLGVLTAGALVLVIGGGVGVAAMNGRRRRAFLRAPRAVHLTGGLVTLYLICLYLAVGLASSRQQVLEITILNYLWPSLTLLFTALALRLTMRPGMAPGMLLATAGMALALMGPDAFTGGARFATAQGDGLPYLLGVTAALSWSLYSALRRRYAGSVEEGGVPLYILLAGLVLAALRGGFPEETRWSPHVLPPLIFMALGPTLLAYLWWDRAMRGGRIVFLVSLAYFVPLLSLAVTALYLRATPGPWLWAACALTIAGAVLCKRSVVESAA